MSPAELEAAQIRAKVKALRAAYARAELYEQLTASPAWAQLSAELVAQVTHFQLTESMRLPLKDLPEARGKAARSQEIVELVVDATQNKAQYLAEIDRLERHLEAAVQAGKIQPVE